MENFQHDGHGVLRRGNDGGSGSCGLLARNHEHGPSSQFTSDEWVSELKAASVQVSMDGKGCWVDNEFIERLWRSLKYEDIYLREYLDVPDLESGVGEWIDFYNHERRHQSLGNQPPWTVYQSSQTPLAA